MKKVILLVLILFLVGCSNDASGEENIASNDEQEDQVEEVESDNGIDIDQYAEEFVKNQQPEVELNDEVSKFVKSFNELASQSDVETIENVEEMLEIEGGSTQLLYISDQYGIIAIFDEDGEISRYSIVLSKDQPYEDLQGEGLNAMLHVGAVLGVDIDELGVKFEEALDKDKHVFFDEELTVMFHNQENDPNWGIAVDFVYL